MAHGMLNVLVVGGYGFFGARIARILASEAGVRLLIAGRNAARAQALARELGLVESQAIVLDAADPDLAGRLRAAAADVVVHTAGPFQGQGHGVARAAIDAGCHYVDLADGREFVAGVGALDTAARERRVSVIGGASSVPALSSAVVARYAERFARLDAVHIGISSGARVPGLATVRGIFGYAGRAFPRLQNGRRVEAHGWLDLTRHRFPSPVGERWLASCDVPDLALLPARYPSLETVSFQAGFASAPGHLAVAGLAWLVRCGWLKSAAGWARPLYRIARWLEPLISERGGMFVTLEGVGAQGREQAITWHLLTGSNHGPFVPCGAAIALVRKLARGEPWPVGAMPCVGLLSVEEYLAPLRDLDVREVPPA
jgi:saccharopine dehydrogenase-like NADP-dependent oxidoreductase